MWWCSGASPWASCPAGPEPGCAPPSVWVVIGPRLPSRGRSMRRRR
ncbi:hypothetical protein [Ornithinimicrobium kibberense]